MGSVTWKSPAVSSAAFPGSACLPLPAPSLVTSAHARLLLAEESANRFGSQRPALPMLLSYCRGLVGHLHPACMGTHCAVLAAWAGSARCSLDLK